MSCTEDSPCRHFDPCARCQAVLYLTDEDWDVIRFYRLVADQVEGVSGMPRLEAYERMGRLNGYGDGALAWLIPAAASLHRLVAKQDTVDWQIETGKRYRDVTIEDVI